MKQTIQVTANVARVELVDKTVEFPEVDTYYIKRKDHFEETLYALIPKYRKDGWISYNIVKVAHNSQEHTDFIPTNDCKSEYWLKDGSNNLRREILDILIAYFGKTEELTKEQFYDRRKSLLDKWIDEI